MARPLLLLCLTACVDPQGDILPTLQFCEGAVAGVYVGLGAEHVRVYPDDALLVEDPSSPTGMRVDTSGDRAPWSQGLPPALEPLLAAVDVLSGFGHNGAVLLSFDGDVGALAGVTEVPSATDPLQLLDLDSGERVPIRAELGDDGRHVMVQPLRPLVAGTEHGLVLTTAHLSSAGDCVSPAWALREILVGEGELAHLSPRYAELAAAAGIEIDQISAATVFTTHDDLGVMVDAAADIRGRSYTWTEAPTCDEDRECRGVFDAWDYRQDDWLQDATPTEAWSLEVRAWMTGLGPGPHPTVIYGHGMNGSRNDGAVWADILNPLGIAVVASDAMRHGDHPTAGGSGASGANFLGIDLSAGVLDGLALRGNFNQTTLDRLQLIELLKANPDLDGDGLDDVDPDQLAYVGVSLGGLLGSSLLALSEDLELGALPVGGGHLVVFATESDLTELLLPFFAAVLGSQDVFDRFLPVLQSVMDPADPASFAPMVARRVRVPHLLLPVAQQDEVVPPAAGRALARALALPHVPPVDLAVPLLPSVASTPASGTWVDGTVTAGFFQLDRVSRDDGMVEPATHDNTPRSPEGRLLVEHFLETWLATGLPEVIDPYVALGTEPLP